MNIPASETVVVPPTETPQIAPPPPPPPNSQIPLPPPPPPPANLPLPQATFSEVTLENSVEDAAIDISLLLKVRRCFNQSILQTSF